MNRSHLVAFVLAATASVAFAQVPDHAADHDALRKLKGDLEQAVSKRDFEAVKSLFDQPFMATVVTQESFTDMGPLKAYYDSLFTRDLLRMKEVSIKAEADELSKIYTGTFATTRGSTTERYVLDDGRAFDMKGRWTAVSIKGADGSWKVLSIHMGANFLDNPVLNAIEKNTLWVGAGSVGLGLLIGFAGGWFARRARAQHQA